MTREEKIQALRSIEVVMLKSATDEQVDEAFSLNFLKGSFDECDGETEEIFADFDTVERPRHYASTSIECIDAMVETQGPEAVKDFCICNAFKYLWRHNAKNGDEDVRKANWYLNKAVEIMGKE